MPAIDRARTVQVYKLNCEDGRRYIVYNAAVIGNPTDHVPDKWYARPYPVSFPLGDDVGAPFDSAEEAERAIRAWTDGPGEAAMPA